MILPIVAYGDPILRKRCSDVGNNSSEIQQLIANMFETMENAKGIGLAAPQVGRTIRLFVVDGESLADEEKHPELRGFRKVFINAEILSESGEEWSYNEGCLSIPKIREDVNRKPTIKIRYLDENFSLHEETFTGLAARIVQHEYDHIEGKLFIDRISYLRRTLLKRRLSDIAKGKVKVEYKMKFSFQK